MSSSSSPSSNNMTADQARDVDAVLPQLRLEAQHLCQNPKAADDLVQRVLLAFWADPTEPGLELSHLRDRLSAQMRTLEPGPIVA